MSRIADVGAAVIGTGFIGTVHVEALRRIGVQVRGVLGSSPERGAPGRALGVPRAYDSLEELLDDPTVDVVHVTSPNHLHLPQARAVLAAGRHVVCEKPLAMTRGVRRAGRARRRDRPGQRGQLQHPLLPAQPARPRRGRRRRARRRPARHRPLLPGLAAPRDRLELAARARARRRAAGGRRHRLALARPDDLHHRPAGRVGDGRARHLHRGPPRADRARSRPSRPRSPPRPSPARSRPRTRPRSCCASRTARAARSPSARSAPAARTRSSTRSTGRASSLAWDSEQPDQMWIGHRERPERDPASGTRRSWGPAGRAAAALPGGHVEGFARHVRGPFRAVYADVAAGGPSPDPPTRPSPTATTRCSSTTPSPRAPGSGAGSTSSASPVAGRRDSHGGDIR